MKRERGIFATNELLIGIAIVVALGILCIPSIASWVSSDKAQGATSIPTIKPAGRLEDTLDVHVIAYEQMPDVETGRGKTGITKVIYTTENGSGLTYVNGLWYFNTEALQTFGEVDGEWEVLTPTIKSETYIAEDSK